VEQEEQELFGVPYCQFTW